MLIQLSHIFGGILFPIELLPKWAQAVSYFFPIRHALESARFAMLSGTSPPELMAYLVPLLAFTLVMLPLSIWSSTYLIGRARRSGALALF